MVRIPPPVVALLGAALAWALAQFAPLGQFAIPGQSATAIVLALAGALLVLSAMRLFVSAKTTINPIRIEEASSLVTTGPYAFTRNPMYLGLLMVVTGWSLSLGVWSALVAPPLFVMYINRFQIRAEEAVMRANFGSAFETYAAKTRRWL